MFVPSFHASHVFKWNWLWDFPALTNEPNRARIHLMISWLDKLTTRFRTMKSSSVVLWISTSSEKIFFRAAREGKEGPQRRGPWFVTCVCGAGLTLAVWTILQVEDDHQRLVAETQAPFVSLSYHLTIDIICISKRAGSLEDIPGPGPVQTLFVGLSPDQLISPTWTAAVIPEVRFIILVRHSHHSATSLGEWNKPLDRVWGILLPLFGMYLPSVHATTNTRKADSAARIIFKAFWKMTNTHETPLQSRCSHWMKG